MKTEIQDTEIYKDFKKALDIQDCRASDNPYIVKCIGVTNKHNEKAMSLIKEARGLIGHPATGQSGSVDLACEDLRDRLTEFIGD